MFRFRLTFPNSPHHFRMTRKARILVRSTNGIAIAGAIVAFSGASGAAPRLTTFVTSAVQAPGEGYTPDQIETAYNIAPLLSSSIDGSGQTIALVELDRFALSDIQQFDSANGLPDPAIKELYAGGKRFSLPREGEATMDLEWAHALAPGAAIQIYYLNGSLADAAGWRQLGATIRQAASNGASTISLSFGACKATSGYTAAQAAFAAARQKGVSVFVSSGDSGALAGPARQCGTEPAVAYPASDPSVVSVGGTSLNLNADDSLASESAWHLSGGGKGKPLPRPSWQVMANLGPGRFRYAPDVGFLANPSTGAAVFYRGSWRLAGGTSLGAPSWAAIWALVRQDVQQSGKTIGAAPPLLYRIGNSAAYHSAFNDVTSGSNGRFSALPGWDAVTGWGTPNAAGLAAAVGAISAQSGTPAGT